MRLKPFLCCTSLLVLLALPAVAEPLAPRGEVSVKGGTDRSLLTTEFWAPLAQQSDRVLYGDIRLMGDNDENREGNLGIGYRQIKNDAVLGVHGWIDRRRTQHNSTFHQLTFGVERLGHVVDARANIYIPINQGRTIITRNIGVTSPYLAGSGIYYDTNGSINETPQYGVDGELGYRLPILQKQADAIRVYGGGYYFFRDNTVEVPGIRFRSEAQINKIVSIGARVQYDKPRGTQGFLEATLKFPFSAKRLYQESGIHSRLDESPERDVDIVTDSKIDTGLFKPVLNTTTGTAQRVLYVDNSNTQNGDGSYENPYNSLKTGEAAVQSHDILYIKRGDGTTHNMDQGIIINKDNVQLIGSGAVFSYAGTTLLNAGAAPVITNTQARIDSFAGAGVQILGGGNITVSGVSVRDTSGSGIVVNSLATDYGSININNNTVSNINTSGVVAGKGIYLQLFEGNTKTVNIGNNTVNQVAGSNASGIQINASGVIETANILSNMVTNVAIGEGINTVMDKGHIGVLNIGNNTANLNASNIVVIGSGGNATYNIDDINIYNNNASSTGNFDGIHVRSTAAGIINNVNITGNTASNNVRDGIRITLPSGQINNIHVEDNILNNNTTTNSRGVYLQLSGTGSLVGQANVARNTMDNNGNGVILDLLTGQINMMKTDSNTITNTRASGRGIGMTASSATTLSTATITNNQVLNSVASGLSFQNNNATVSDLTVSGNTVSNGQTGISVNTTGASGRTTRATIANNTTNANSNTGLLVSTSTGQLGTLSVTGNTSSTNANTGIHIQSLSGALIGSATVSNNTANSNTGASGRGVYVQLNATSAITTAVLSGNTTSNNAQQGMLIYADNGNISTASITGNTANANANIGVSIQLLTGASIGSATLSNNASTNNTGGSGDGFRIQTLSSSSISAVLTGNTATGNAASGYSLNTSSGSTGSYAVSMVNNNAVNNTVYGVAIDHDAANTVTYAVDLGGGSLGSTGGNRIYNNTSRDVFVDTVPTTGSGTLVYARNNWWGVNTGLAGGRQTLEGTSTLDSTAFLTLDPRP